MNRILHLGLGSFHRAHQAVYLHHLREQGDRSWAIVGGNIRGDMAETMAALAAQNGEYTMETVSPAGERSYERIRSIERVIPFDPDLAGLLDAGTDPATRIISFTVTEAGYYLDPKNRLDLAFPDLRADLEQNKRTTIYGAIAAILRQRIKRGSGAVTLQNCDNLRSNGERFRLGLLDFCERQGDRELRAWVEANTACPNAMVDRITPRPLPEVIERVRAATGWNDRVPVMGERFIQWVIEDHFCNGRPAWEKVGAEMVASILNASHSCIAWAGTLIGLGFIHEGAAIDAIRRMVYEYVTDDVIPCLDTPAHPSPVNLAGYRDVVLDRFTNPYLRDTNQRVAMDGFAKIPGFIAPTLRERLGRGESIRKTAVLPALFFAFLDRWQRGTLSYTYEDQGMDQAAARAFFRAPEPIAAYCRDPILWGPLAGNKQLLSAVAAAYEQVLAFVQEHRNGGRKGQ